MELVAGGNFKLVEPVCWLKRKCRASLPVLTISYAIFEQLNATDAWLCFATGTLPPPQIYIKVVTSTAATYWYRAVVDGTLELLAPFHTLEGYMNTVVIRAPHDYVESYPILKQPRGAPMGYLQLYTATLRAFWQAPYAAPHVVYGCSTRQHTREYICRLDAHRFQFALTTAAEIMEVITYLLPKWSYLALLAGRPGFVSLAKPLHGAVLRPNYCLQLERCFVPAFTTTPSAHFFASSLEEQLKLPPEEQHVQVGNTWYIFIPFVIYYQQVRFCIQAWCHTDATPKKHYEKMMLRMSMHST